MSEPESFLPVDLSVEEIDELLAAVHDRVRQYVASIADQPAWGNDEVERDLDGLEDAGTVSADVSGTSFLPAIIVPVPLIARTQAKACKALADQLKLFIVADEEV